MTDLLYVATAHAVVVAERDRGEWREVSHGLEGQRVTCITAHGDVVHAGTREGVFRSLDGGQSWQPTNEGLTVRYIRWLAHHPGDPAVLLVGTEPATIHVSRDGGETWRECPEVADMRDEGGWYLPYSPAAGCVRGFAFYGARVYAAVEQGGVLRSNDIGETWRIVQGSSGRPEAEVPAGHIHPDVHSVNVHPSSPDRVTAATGGGLYRSTDGGSHWELLYRCYCRAVWLDPDDHDHLIFGPADSVNTGGRIEESVDGGQTWRYASLGLDIPWRQHMVERFEQAGQDLFAVLSNGHIVTATLADLTWQRVLPDVRDVTALASPTA
ncbi:MAG TPA: hypothetical protein GX714_16495 [Chloroflexi bacterium]|jgi:photosystem II stability/assembly factor-like uncharacterized protein|nr:hypothetical protein [Chloroflexota bacterium]